MRKSRLSVNIFVNFVCVAVLSKETKTCCEFLPEKRSKKIYRFPPKIYKDP